MERGGPESLRPSELRSRLAHGCLHWRHRHRRSAGSRFRPTHRIRNVSSVPRDADNTYSRKHMRNRLPELDKIKPDTPLRLDVAAALAYPDGSMTASGLRKEAGRGRLAIERVAGKDYTT